MIKYLHRMIEGQNSLRNLIKKIQSHRNICVRGPETGSMVSLIISKVYSVSVLFRLDVTGLIYIRCELGRGRVGQNRFALKTYFSSNENSGNVCDKWWTNLTLTRVRSGTKTALFGSNIPTQLSFCTQPLQVIQPKIVLVFS